MVLLIAVLAVLVFLNSTAPDGIQDTEHRYRIALLEAQGLRSGSTRGRRDMHRSSTGEQPIKNAPTPEEIRQRAFEIHIERGGIHGCATRSHRAALGHRIDRSVPGLRRGKLADGRNYFGLRRSALGRHSQKN
jgi:hypothetical protein